MNVLVLIIRDFFLLINHFVLYALFEMENEIDYSNKVKSMDTDREEFHRNFVEDQTTLREKKKFQMILSLVREKGKQ